MIIMIIIICGIISVVINTRQISSRKCVKETVSSVPSPTCEKVASEDREVRSFIGWNFFSAQMYYQFGYLDRTVSQVMSVCILPQRWYVTVHYLGWSSTKFIFVHGHSVVLGNYTLFTFAPVMDGYYNTTYKILSCEGYAFFQVRKNSNRFT